MKASSALGATVAAGWLALTGCTAIELAIGRKVRLDKIPIRSIRVILPKGPAIVPGGKSPLMVVVTEADGTVLLTEGEGDGKVMWKDLLVATTLVAFDQKGVLSLRKDPRFSEGKRGHVTVTVPSHPDLKAELDVPVRYNDRFVCDFSESSGSSGASGSDGMQGAAGGMGSIDLDNPSPGGNGSNGTDGSNGGDGGPGGDAPAVEVQLTVRPGNPLLLQALVSAAGHKRRYLVDPKGGSLTVNADGGPGGEGGSAGRGGGGGAGGVGMPNGFSGTNGLDGCGGWPGPPGKGGMITMIYDPKAKPFLNIVHLSSKNGPAPAIREQPVAPLW